MSASEALRAWSRQIASSDPAETELALLSIADRVVVMEKIVAAVAFNMSNRSRTCRLCWGIGPIGGKVRHRADCPVLELAEEDRP